MQSYLSGDEFEVDASQATSPLAPAFGDAPPASDLVTLPGGIVVPRKTLLTLLAVAAAVALFLYLRKRERRLRRLERASASEEGGDE
jgi:hypothetical protein